MRFAGAPRVAHRVGRYVASADRRRGQLCTVMNPQCPTYRSGKVVQTNRATSISTDDEFAQQATSSLLERVSQNANLTVKTDDQDVVDKDEPYELIIRFNSRPSDNAAHAIVDALLSVFSKHRVDAKVIRANEQVL